MKKKISDKQLRLYAIILLLILPFLTVNIGLIFKFEGIARLIGLLILFCFFPLAFMAFALNPNYKKDFELSLAGKRRSMPLRIIVLILGLFGVWHLTLPLLLDVFSLIELPTPTTNGIVSYSQTTAYDLLVWSQKIRLNKESDEYNIVYSTKWLKKGSKIEIKYLPRTRLILEATVLDK